MGFFKDVWSTITGTVSDVTTIVNNMDLTGKKTSNIADKARQGILQFPCICSNSIDMATASLICKAVEKRYAVFVQEVYSLYSVATVDGNNEAIADYIRTQHHNINNSASMADVINVVRGSFENLTITDFEEPVFLESIIIALPCGRAIYTKNLMLVKKMLLLIKLMLLLVKKILLLVEKMLLLVKAFLMTRIILLRETLFLR